MGRDGGRFHKCQYYGCEFNLKISDRLPCLSEGVCNDVMPCMTDA